MDFEKFYTKMWKINETLVITIPKNLAEGTGWKEGDMLKVMARKKEEDE